MKRRYDPKSARSVAGKEFQNKVLKEFRNSEIFENVEDFRERKRAEGIAAGRPYTEVQLSVFEKSWGDITFLVGDHRFYVECCLAMGEHRTSMCEIKRTRFVGDNKWYCYGKRTDPDARIFIHSQVWHDYMSRLNLNQKHGWQYRTVDIKRIGPHIRAAIIGQKNFEKLFKGNS
jgi:hypothetical protein